MKGIILAGGTGTRLNPITISFSKQLLPVYDKPLIYYPLSTLLNLKITEILIIVNPDQILNFKKLLGDGSMFGIKLKYIIQKKPNGIAESFVIGRNFIKDSPVALILGDNIFYGQDFYKDIKLLDINNSATIFLYKVNNPSQYGVANLKNNKIKSIVEKPKKTTSNLAVTGLYLFDKNVIKNVNKLKPSKRGELEITDLNNIYLKNKNLNYIQLNDSSVWFDAGTPISLLYASQYIQAVQTRNNILISSPEEISLKNKLIKKSKFKKNLISQPSNEYFNFLRNLIK
tara:strand:- start:129 stop:986 length:858 start_codon:yes stop_codon:yes gene_type:complete